MTNYCRFLLSYPHKMPFKRYIKLFIYFELLIVNDIVKYRTQKKTTKRITI